MKLYIEEFNTNTNNLVTEALLYEYINSNYDYDLTRLFLEILAKNKPIKLDSEYINDANDFDNATEDNIKQYANDPTFKELKSDMYDFATDICKDIKKLPEVEDATVKSSQSVGLSTYITVKFKLPTKDNPIVRKGLETDKKFIGHYKSGFGDGHGYEGEYTLKFRLSNHAVKRATDADKDINITGKTYDRFRDEILNVCKRHAQKLDNYLKNFANTGKIPDKQKQRNLDRRERDRLYNNNIKELLTYLCKSYVLKESYGTEVLDTRLDIDTQSLFNRYHINKEDIIDAVQVYFREVPMVFADLIRIAAACINANANSYILGNNDFNLQEFLNDMETVIINKYPKYFI